LLATYLLAFALLACPLHEGKHEQIEAATAALEQAPQSLGLRLARAEVYLLHGEYQDCAGDLLLAESLAGEDLAVQLLRARLQFAQKQYPTCLSGVDRVLAAKLEQPTRLIALQLRASCLTELANVAMTAEEGVSGALSNAAAEAWSLLITTHPQPQPDWYLTRAKLQASSPRLAIDGLNQGLHLLGNVVSLLLRAAELEEQLGLTSAAVARLEVLAKQSTRKETWLTRQGAVLQRAGQAEQARTYFERALSAWQQLPEKRRNTFSMQRLFEEITTGLKENQDG
jgi:tetratricopeptide (TPR) repeat protein